MFGKTISCSLRAKAGRRVFLFSLILFTGCSTKAPPPLIQAASSSGAVEVKNMLTKGTNVDTRSQTSEIALMTAASHGHLEIVKVLLTAGADVNAKTQKGGTSLIVAATNCYT